MKKTIIIRSSKFLLLQIRWVGKFHILHPCSPKILKAVSNDTTPLFELMNNQLIHQTHFYIENLANQSYEKVITKF